MRIRNYLSAMFFVFSGCLFFIAGCANAPTSVHGPGARCPMGRSGDAMFCADIVRYARDPDTGICCRYDTVCAAPAGWKTYSRKSSCEAAGDSSE